MGNVFKSNSQYMELKNFFLTVLGLCCCVQAFSGCSGWGYSLVMVRGLFVTVASLVEGHRLSSLAQVLSCPMAYLPEPGIEPESPALASGFLTAGPPGKS